MTKTAEQEVALNSETLDMLREMCERNLAHHVAKGEKPVFGEGPSDSRIMIIGEAPGAKEARTGRPFVGNAGRLLTTLLVEIGLERNEVYITNILKTHPRGNRTPNRRMILEQLPYLKRQIQMIAPGIMVLLGATALKGLIDPHARITRLRGTWLRFEGIPTLVTYHPAAVFHDDTKKELLRQDFQALRKELDRR
ncbi:MAG: uracil-DNA glycosylase [Chitinivibrionales bacterium]|nr:uracil-DNA glycosylase [Chitinivibrionales bacterium]MBD3355526.1 uracil-DNA glycosylase [Chitinivibrionales bacterium]